MDIYFEELENFEGTYDEYEDLRKELESKIIPDNYSELSFEEQLAICEKHSDNICYSATSLIEF